MHFIMSFSEFNILEDIQELIALREEFIQHIYWYLLNALQGLSARCTTANDSKRRREGGTRKWKKER